MAELKQGNLSRREFMQVGVLAAGATVLAACGLDEIPQPTATVLNYERMSASELLNRPMSELITQLGPDLNETVGRTIAAPDVWKNIKNLRPNEQRFAINGAKEAILFVLDYGPEFNKNIVYVGPWTSTYFNQSEVNTVNIGRAKVVREGSNVVTSGAPLVSGTGENVVAWYFAATSIAVDLGDRYLRELPSISDKWGDNPSLAFSGLSLVIKDARPDTDYVVGSTNRVVCDMLAEVVKNGGGRDYSFDLTNLSNAEQFVFKLMEKRGISVGELHNWQKGSDFVELTATLAGQHPDEMRGNPGLVFSMIIELDTLINEVEEGGKNVDDAFEEYRTKYLPKLPES